jgi:hypothetical protein
MIRIPLDEASDRVVGERLPVDDPDSAQNARTTSQRVAYLLSGDHEYLPQAQAVLDGLNRGLPDTLVGAFSDRDAAALLDVHRALFAIYEVSFCNPLAPAALHEHSGWLVNIRKAMETAWLDFDLNQIKRELPKASDIADVDSLCAWFIHQAKKESLIDVRVVRFLEREASLNDFIAFILSDANLNYRFYDALALAQLHYSESVKAEISLHMWDECGCGDGDLSHTRQFTRTLQSLQLQPPAVPVWTDWRPYAGYNLYFCFGLSRAHYFKAIGSLAMPELFDPERDRAVVAGLERLGFNGPKDFEYYYNHITGDENHGERWLRHVIAPIVKAQPQAARELAIGGALRMEYMRRYNEYLAEEFGLLK